MSAKLPEKKTTRLLKWSVLSYPTRMSLLLAAPHGTHSHHCSHEGTVAQDSKAAFRLPFPGRDDVGVAHWKAKSLTLFLKSLNSAQSHFLVYNKINLNNRSCFCRIPGD